jgi:hypothetical protein
VAAHAAAGEGRGEWQKQLGGLGGDLGGGQFPLVVLLLVDGEAALQTFVLASGHDLGFAQARVVYLNFELLALLALLVTHHQYILFRIKSLDQNQLSPPFCHDTLLHLPLRFRQQRDTTLGCATRLIFRVDGLLVKARLPNYLI